ncbi:MAG: response regulator, partial [Helicobacteraceae bacterium]|nr:response regulator [Helicobacteraceae bacterium]
MFISMHSSNELLKTALFVLFLVLIMFVVRLYIMRLGHGFLSAEKLLNEYRAIIDKAASMSKTDINGKIIFVNDKFCEQCGYEREYALGKTHSILRHPDTPDKLYRAMWDTILSGKTWRGVMKNVKKNGETYYVDSTIQPIFSNGKLVEFMTLRFNVTEMQNALIEAKSAQQSKDMFLSNMSHEIRTPLNAILGFVELLETKITDPEQSSYLKTISRNSKKLLITINDVLDIAKIQSGNFTIKQEQCDLYEDIVSTIFIFNANAEAKGVHISYIFSANFPQTVITDSNRVNQIIANLLSNALKFTPKGHSIFLFALYDEAVETLNITVEDEGTGIPEEWRKKIFEPFTQVSDTDVMKGGTGLGLSICHEIATLLGGSITLESELGKGSAFTLAIPAKRGDSDRQMKTAAAPNSAFSVHGYRILVAEDQPDNQKYISILLERMGFEIVMTSNGQEALECYVTDDDGFDLVLLDENMPIMNGTEVLKRVRGYEAASGGKRTPVAILTANAIKGDRERFLSEGFDSYLSKPISGKDLSEMIKKLLSTPPFPP